MKRRGISSVVGTVFAIIALASTVGYITYSMNVLDQYNQAVLARNQQSTDIASEKFVISNVNYANNKLNITVANTGSLPVNFTKIWITDKSVTTPPLWVKSYTPTTNRIVAPANMLKNLGQDFPIALDTTKPYHVKLVTSRGNIQEFDINSAASVSNGNIQMQLFASPDKIPEGFTTTLTMTVTNNQTGNAYLVNVAPNSPTITKIGSPILTVTQMSVDPAPIPVLSPGQTATFVWSYMIAGSNGDSAQFTTSLKNGNGKTVYDTVTIADVLNAMQSTSSLQSQGISCCRTNDNVVVLHQESLDTPTYNNVAAYDLYGGQVDSSGKTVELSNSIGSPNNSIKFITQNDSSSETDIPPGPWTLSLKYVSDPMPPSLLTTNEPDMMFLFNSGNALTTDSTGCPANTMNVTNTLSLQSTTPRDGSTYVTLDGSTQSINVALNAGIGGPGQTTCFGNDNSNNKDSTAAWFKTSTSPSGANKYIIYKQQQSNSNNPQFYEISMISGGKITFSFNATKNSGIITCTTTKNYADNNWHHVVVARNGKQCNLYTDGSASNVPNGESITAGAPNGDKFNSLGKVYIGRAPTGGSYFPGSLDDIAHWNNIQVTSQQANDLWTKNHGTSAHTLEVSIYEADKNGVAQYTVLPKQTVTLPFMDGLHADTGTPVWKTYNLTGSNFNLSNATDANGIFHFVPNSRMLVNVTWAAPSQHPEASPMHWRIDDNSILNDPYTSYVQFPMPIPDFPFPSYFTYDHTKQLTFTASNAGPNGLWLTFSGTRAIFQSLTNTTASSYATVITKGNNSNIDTNTDSPYMKVGAKLNLIFNFAYSIPSTGGVPPGATQITVGHYRMFVAVTGYDTAGNTLSRVFYVGIVKVT